MYRLYRVWYRVAGYIPGVLGLFALSLVVMLFWSPPFLNSWNGGSVLVEAGVLSILIGSVCIGIEAAYHWARFALPWEYRALKRAIAMDPVLSLVSQRTVLERAMRDIVPFLPEGVEDSLFTRLQIVEKAGRLPEKMVSELNYLRKAANDAAHMGVGDLEKALECRAALGRFLTWRRFKGRNLVISESDAARYLASVGTGGKPRANGRDGNSQDGRRSRRSS